MDIGIIYKGLLLISILSGLSSAVSVGLNTGQSSMCSNYGLDSSTSLDGFATPSIDGIPASSAVGGSGTNRITQTANDPKGGVSCCFSSKGKLNATASSNASLTSVELGQNSYIECPSQSTISVSRGSLQADRKAGILDGLMTSSPIAAIEPGTFVASQFSSIISVLGYMRSQAQSEADNWAGTIGGLNGIGGINSQLSATPSDRASTFGPINAVSMTSDVSSPVESPSAEGDALSYKSPNGQLESTIGAIPNGLVSTDQVLEIEEYAQVYAKSINEYLSSKSYDHFGKDVSGSMSSSAGSLAEIQVNPKLLTVDNLSISRSISEIVSSLDDIDFLTTLTKIGAYYFPSAPAPKSAAYNNVTATPGLNSVSASVTTPQGVVSGMDPEKKLRADRLISVFENGVIDLQYGFAKNLHDGRGITCGFEGFCTGTGDAYLVVKQYTDLKPNNVLAKYLPELKRLLTARNPAATSNLNGYIEDWATAARDPAFNQVQHNVASTLYFIPAMNYASSWGIKTSLGKAFLYDTIVQHGDGDDRDSISAIYARTVKNVGGSPSSGMDEKKFIVAFIAMRRADLAYAYDPKTRDGWAESVSRCDIFSEIVNAGNWNLDGPITIKNPNYEGTIVP